MKRIKYHSESVTYIKLLLRTVSYKTNEDFTTCLMNLPTVAVEKIKILRSNTCVSRVLFLGISYFPSYFRRFSVLGYQLLHFSPLGRGERGEGTEGSLFMVHDEWTPQSGYYSSHLLWVSSPLVITPGGSPKLVVVSSVVSFRLELSLSTVDDCIAVGPKQVLRVTVPWVAGGTRMTL